MIREVLIDGKQVDVNDTSLVGYKFTSPIFRDITKIGSNRTTTFKIPKTERNLSLIGHSENPDVNSEFPYRMHTFTEYRDGLIFIHGTCYLLAVVDQDIEFAVFWGNSQNVLKLKELNLRDLNSTHSVIWAENISYLPYEFSNRTPFGYVAVDFGRGTTDSRYVHPSINFRGVLNEITGTTGVQFYYTEDFEESMRNLWIPLIDKNADELTWVDYTIKPEFGGYINDYENTTIIRLSADNDPKNILLGGLINKDFGESFKIKVDAILVFKNPDAKGKLEPIRLSFAEGEYKQTGNKGVFFPYETLYQKIATAQDDGSYTLNFSTTIEGNTRYPLSAIFIEGIDSSGDRYKISNLDFTTFDVQVQIQTKEVKKGDRFPIVPNLPDIKVMDFLKSIMFMFGLFTYFDGRSKSTIARFISIDDMYRNKDKAYDWTNKLVDSGGARYKASFTYGDYAQKNTFKYAEDETVETQADGYIEIDDTTINKEKELIKLPYAPSDNITQTGDYQNTIAKIDLYDKDGKTNNVEYRALTGNSYIIKGPDGSDEEFMGAYFDESQKFSGDKGYLKKYYSSFQHVLRRSVVMECIVYLNEYDLFSFREIYPIYIDGNYYMPVEVMVQTNGVAVCKLIKMPYLDPNTLSQS